MPPRAWTFNVRFLAGVFTCLLRRSGWRNPYAVG
jgi:hypothetical protein